MIGEFYFADRQKEAQRKLENLSLAIFMEEEDIMDHGIGLSKLCSLIYKYTPQFIPMFSIETYKLKIISYS